MIDWFAPFLQGFPHVSYSKLKTYHSWPQLLLWKSLVPCIKYIARELLTLWLQYLCYMTDHTRYYFWCSEWNFSSRECNQICFFRTTTIKAQSKNGSVKQELNGKRTLEAFGMTCKLAFSLQMVVSMNTNGLCAWLFFQPHAFMHPSIGRSAPECILHGGTTYSHE